MRSDEAPSRRAMALRTARDKFMATTIVVVAMRQLVHSFEKPNNATMKIPKMLLQYTVMFTVPSAIALYYWQPRSDEEIRRDVEAKVRPDVERRRKNQAKYRELLLQRHGATSEESQQQLDEVTSFATPRKS